MKKTFIKLLTFCLCVALLAVPFAGCAKKNENYVIGFSAPLTGSAAVYGTACKNSAEMAVEEINAAGGIDGVKFDLIVLDDQHDTSKVATNYAELMDKGMHFSLGCITTNPCLEFAKLSKEDNVFFLTPSASGDAVTKENNAYQMCFADGNQGTVAAEYVNSLNLDKLGIFYKSDDPYSKGIYDKFVATINKDIEVVATNFIGEGKDFKVQIDKLKDCKFIFMPVYFDAASNFMTQAKGTIAADATYYGCDGFDGIESAKGFDITAIPQKISMLSHFNSKATEGKAADFVKKYTEKYGKETLSQFGAATYDSVYAIYEALKAAKAAGKDFDVNTSASDFCEILKEQFNGEFKFTGNTGTDIKWHENGYVNKSAIAYVIKEAD